jgi:hypothetical protein
MYDESQAEAMSCAQIEYDKAVMSDKLYFYAMELTAMGCQAENVDKFIRAECASNQLSYPPKQLNS